MTAEVHQLHTEKLDRLVVKIKQDLDRRAKSTTEWVEATLDLCADLAEARAEFPGHQGDKEFGRWLDANQVELSHQDRAAAIAMGADRGRAREVLTATKSRSLRLICANEFMFTSAGKHTQHMPPRPPTKKQQKAFAAYDRLAATGVEVTRQAVMEAAGVSNTVADRVCTTRRAAAVTELPELSMTAQQKLEVWQHKLEAEFDHRVYLEARKQMEELHIPAVRKELDAMAKMLASPRYAVMRKGDYNKIMKCLHPDRMDGVTVEELAEAFRIFTHYKLKMINDEEERKDALRRMENVLPSREEALAQMMKGKRSR